MRRRIDWFVIVFAALVGASCSGGGGCGGCGIQPIPGGFKPEKRVANAAQLRVSQSGLAAITDNPAALISALTGTSALTFNVPASCSGSTPVCCPGGVAQNPCGPVNIDLSLHAGDTPRLELHPKQGASELDVVVRARVTSTTDIPVKVPVVGNCGIKLDTTTKSPPDIEIDAPIDFVQDATSGTTRIVVGTVGLQNLSTDDVSLTGGFGCTIANVGLSFFIGTLKDQLTGVVQSTIQDQTCKACASGDVAECGSPFATACTGGVCQEGSAGCLQELGLDGRLPASALFGSFSPGTTGALDLYEVTGGYATTNINGIALGLLGGMQPGGTARDACGPAATEPAVATVPVSTYFEGNTNPDTGQTFDVAIGVHQSQLAQLAFAGYNGGLFCLTVGHAQVAQLTTETIALLSRSLGKLVEKNSPVAVGLRPQSAPVITLGTNTFGADGMGGTALTDPLLDIKFTAMEIDFFVSVDDQYVRAFTVVSDVHLPIGLQVTGTGQLQPVIGDVANAFTNISVKNTQAVTESPADLAALFPTILNLVIPQLSSGLGAISLPSVAGLDLSVSAITAVDNKTFLAIFANLAPHMAFAPTTTRADVLAVADADDATRASPRLWRGRPGPSVTLALGGDAADLEWQWRSDGGLWEPWQQNPRPTLAKPAYWLPGTHHLEVRSRRIGHPETLDTIGTTIELPFGSPSPRVDRGGQADFHGTGTGAGCACDSGGGSAGQAAPFALVLGLLLLPWRALRRRAVRLGATTWLIALFALPGCDCSNASNACGDTACVDGDVARGGVGRYTSIAGDDTRVMVATYDQGLGDLVAVDATDPANLVFTAVDGIPAGVAPTHDPSTYRGGVEEPGPNVGIWTSIALSNGTARIAYQDRDLAALKYAFETSPGQWQSYVLDAGDGVPVGDYASMVIDANGHPAVVYLAVGVDDHAGHRATELRLERAHLNAPTMSDWDPAVIATAPGSCAGACGTSGACVTGAAATDPQECAVATTDCATACSDTQVCVATVCRTAVADPTVDVPPQGTGLYVSLVGLPDGRLAAAYYDSTRRALVLAVEDGPATNTFTETVLDGNVAGRDVGLWASAAVGTDGTVHVAYQDALGDQQLYTTWTAAGPGVPQVVDDGQRSGDRPHPVGAAAALVLAAGTPMIAYQDGMLADVMVATPSGAVSWSPAQLATGPLLEGFSIGVTTGHGATPVFAWESLDPTLDPPMNLVVKTQ